MPKIFNKIFYYILNYQVLKVGPIDSCYKTNLYYYHKTQGYQDQEVCRRDDSPDYSNLWKHTQVNQDKASTKMASGSGINGFYRPRSALARALYEKHRNDRYLEEYDHTEVRRSFVLTIISL